MKWCTIAAPSPGGEDLGHLHVAYGKPLFVGRQLHERGLAGWQPATTAALCAAWEIAGPLSPVFFDVGANIGIYALLHSRLWPHGRAVAFEPTPHIATCGGEMTAANGLSVQWERVAVSDNDGEGTLHLSSRSDASNSLVDGHRRAKGILTVPTVTLDTFCDSRGLTPSVVKLDVERHEAAVIRGASRLLDEHRPIVVAELLPGHAEAEEVQQLMMGHGYTARLIEPPHHGHNGGALNDWLFWPGAVPAPFDARFSAWFASVARCAVETVAAGMEPRRP